MKLNKTREQLIKMYLEALKENQIPWRKCWNVNGVVFNNVNGSSNILYKGVNQMLLSIVTSKENYQDNRWLTFKQIQNKGYKLKNCKGKGVPIEFWSVYDLVNKRKVDYLEYQKVIKENPEEKKNYRLFCKTTFVYNGTFIVGLPKLEKTPPVTEKINISRYIMNLIKKLDVKYKEEGNRAFYRPLTDEIVLPKKENFIDKYSYYATQLHEISHSTGNVKRLNRNLVSDDIMDRAREELVAEISSSFLVQKLNISTLSEHCDNHKAYIQSWIKILENQPQELFKAINEANRIGEYIESLKLKQKDKER